MLPTTLLRSVLGDLARLLQRREPAARFGARWSRSFFHSAAVTRVLRQLALQSASSNGFSPAAHRFISDSP